MSLLHNNKIVIFGPLSSGHIQKWMHGLKGEFDITYITYHDGDVDGKKIVLPNILSSKLNYILCYPILLFHLFRIKPKIVHAHYFSSYGIILSMVPFVREKILSVWGSDINNIKINSKLKIKFYSLILSRFSYINSAAKHLTKKILLINDSLNVETYQYGVKNLPKVSPKKSCKSQSVIKFFSSRNFDELYRVDMLIESFISSITKYNIDAELYIYGKGDELETIKVQELCNGNDNVYFLGYVDSEILIKNIVKYDVIVSIPTKDGTPLSLFEGVAYGCYPLLSDIEANRNWFDDNNATYCDFSDSNILTEKILKVYEKIKNRDSDYEYILKKNWEMAFLSCNYDVNIMKIKRVYKRILNE